ncbi:unnamed protein product, partial [marine sediment metagenome]
MWETIKKLFRKIFETLSIPGGKADHSTEINHEIIKDETEEIKINESVDLFEDSILGKEQIDIADVDKLTELKEQTDTKHIEH